MKLKRKKLIYVLTWTKDVQARGHITFWRTWSVRRCVAQNACIFQNVSSSFARLVDGAKGDIRISQLNTFSRICFLLIYFWVSYFIYNFYARIDVSIVLPTYSLGGEGYKYKKCPAFAGHRIYTPTWRTYAQRPWCYAHMLPFRWAATEQSALARLQASLQTRFVWLWSATPRLKLEGQSYHNFRSAKS